MRRQGYDPSGLTLASALGVGDGVVLEVLGGGWEPVDGCEFTREDLVLRRDEVAHAVERGVLRRRRSECQGCPERYRGVVH